MDDSNVRRIDLFEKRFKGFIVRSTDIKVRNKEVQYVPGTKLIDRSKIVCIEYVKNGCVNDAYLDGTDDDDSGKKIICLKGSDPPIYGRIAQRVRINCVECVVAEYVGYLG